MCSVGLSATPAQVSPVPRVITVGPGKWVLKAREEVVEGPGEDDVVICAQQEAQDHRCCTSTCRPHMQMFDILM